MGITIHFIKKLKVAQAILKVTQLVRGRAWIQMGTYEIPEALLILLTSKTAELFGEISIPHIIFYLFI